MVGNATKAIVMMDVCGSSKLWRRHPAKMSAHLDALFAHVQRRVKASDGVLVKTIGDAFMVAFDTLTTAVCFAVDFQISWRQTVQGKLLRMRVGVAEGPVLIKSWPVQGCHGMVDYFGSTVNIASRLESHVSEQGGVAFAPGTPEVVAAVLDASTLPHTIKHIEAVEFRDGGKRCGAKEGLRNSARLVPFSMSCHNTARLKHVPPFTAVAIRL